MKKVQSNQPKRWETANQWKSIELPVNEPLGIYPRQSTKGQLSKNIQSYEIQTEDMIKMAIERGWDRNLITLYDQDFAKSGTIDIDEREGMFQMLSDIKNLKIKAVFVFMEDRLFRDEYQTNVDIFIKVCSEAGCIVFTPMMVYDFSNKWHRKQFRDACERAWEYLDEQIMLRLHWARHRAASQGLYDGRALPVGYFVDKDKNSETYKKFIQYEPHAKVVKYLFKRFIELGSLGALAQEVASMTVLFPQEAPEHAPQFTRVNLLKVQGGYHVSYSGLRKILINHVYIGWWKVGDEFVKDNHQPILDEETFWYVRRSLVRENKEESDEEQKNYHTTTSSVVRDVLSAKPYQLAANNPRGIYVIVDDRSIKRYALATIPIQFVEKTFLDIFLQRLHDLNFSNEYLEAAAKEDTTEQERRAFIQEQCNQTQKRIDGIFLTLQDPELDPEQRKEFIETRKKLIVQRDKYQEELNTPSSLQQFYSYQELVQKIGPHWNKLPLERRQLFVKLLVKRVHFTYLSPHFVKIVIDWKRLGQDVGVIWRPMSSTYGWEDDELEILYKLYPEGTTEELMKALPRRSYNSYNSMAQLKGTRKLKRSTEPERPDLSFNDLRVMEEYDVEEENTGMLHSVTWFLPY